MECHPLLVARRLLGLDVVFQINPQGNSFTLFGHSGDNAALDTFFDCFLGVGFPQSLAAGKAFLSGSAERNKFSRFDLIALRPHEPQEVVKVFGLRDGGVNGGFQLRFPARPFPLGVPFGVALALALAGLHHGQSVFLTQPVAGTPDVGIALFIGNVLALIHHIHRTENNVIMNVSFVYVGCQHIGVFSLPLDKQIKQFSKGMKMKLAISVAFSHHSKLLILDEATSGLDPVIRDDILDMLLDFVQDEEHSVLVSSHITSDLEKIADYIVFIHEGKVVFSKPKDELIEQYGIIKCGASQFDALDKSDIIVHRKMDYEWQALISARGKMQKKYPKAMIVPATIDEIMLLYVKGEKE